MSALTRWEPMTRWNPFKDLEDIEHRLSSYLGRPTVRTEVGKEAMTVAEWSPLVDITEDDKEYLIKADLPEVDPKDLDIRVENNLLTIRGERKFEKKVNEENYLRVERSFGSFARSFTLANTVNPDAIKAEYQNGVLTLTIPKREEAKPKQIKVNVNAPAVAAAASGR